MCFDQRHGPGGPKGCHIHVMIEDIQVAPEGPLSSNICFMLKRKREREGKEMKLFVIANE